MDFELQFVLFWAIAGLTALSAIMVVVTQNIVRSAAWLLFALGGTSGIFFLLGADFVGATQLLVYVGGTLVLVVFGVMLTAQGPFITMKTGAAEWAIATVVGVLLYAVIGYTVIQANVAGDKDFFKVEVPKADPATSQSSTQLGQGFLNITEATPEGKLTGLPTDKKREARTRMGYLLPFEIVSVHLLVVLLGAAYLARAKRRREGTS
jgi:NADH-quinone oxidoreductase subunit J